MIYTNGELIKKAIETYPGLMSSVWLYAVSIDGTVRQHNRNRLGTHLKNIHDNLAELKKIRTEKILMWSTLREDQSLLNCFEEFLYLKEKQYVDQFFWHWIETSEPFNSFERYIKSYERDLSKIMDTYLKWLYNKRILPIAHINELILYN